MEIIRVGNKVISKEKINYLIGKILQLRASGSTQADVANSLGVERSFISRLEGLGEVRSGKRVALVGFPIANKKEVEELALRKGIEFVYLLSQEERKFLERSKTSAEVFNELLDVLSFLVNFDVVIFLGSDKRVAQFEQILGRRVIGCRIGKSPIEKSVIVDLNTLEVLLEKAVKPRKWEVWREKGRQRKLRLFKKRPQGRS